MERAKHDWSTKHEDMLKILESRATAGKYHATCYCMFLLPSALFIMTCHIASFILIKETGNGTRTNYFPIMTEYMIDEEKYLYLIVFHQNLSLLICASVYMGTEALYIMWLHHAASLFEVSSYHIQEAVSKGSVQQNDSQELVDFNSKRSIISAVIAHRKATRSVFAR
ncbi:uncharacterized protein LOC128876574 [Hylaeus volcanicus]|uniref:uncharacterized protein LOC128876574 n=1 Tax=Hylaeus volcanicus TaxID=313075 RepID=UPI0023B87797|nr:uncharacterized protein LOC128876574 [Hylaeus volcanicus]